MREPKNQMLGTMEPPLMQLSVNVLQILYYRSTETLHSVIGTLHGIIVLALITITEVVIRFHLK